VTLLVKDPERPGPARIHYTDIGDYLSREQKLMKLSSAASGDWLNQRKGDFGSFLALRDEIFRHYSLGVSTSRDWWTVGSSPQDVEMSVDLLVRSYNAALRSGDGAESLGSHQVSWSRGLRNRFGRGRPLFDADNEFGEVMYRPFHRQWGLLKGPLLEAAGQTPTFFAHPDQSALSVLRPNDRTPFSALAVSAAPNLGLFMDPPDVDGYRRLDNITDHALTTFRAAYGDRITKDDIFFYVYGLLHSPDYRETYAADLKKMLPRIPLVTDPWPLSKPAADSPSCTSATSRSTPIPLRDWTIRRRPATRHTTTSASRR
jgi:predicted helicase